MGRHACFLAVCISSAWTVSASSQDGVLTLDSGWSMQSSVECGGLDVCGCILKTCTCHFNIVLSDREKLSPHLA